MPTRHGTVMLTLDGSDFADQAIERTQEIAAELDSKVVLLDVLPDRRGPSAFSIEGARAAERRDATAHLLEAKARLNEAGIEDVEMVAMESASPATAIVEAARTLDCDMVVMMTHGRTGIRRALRGSVAQDVARGLDDIEVVLVREEEE